MDQSQVPDMTNYLIGQGAMGVCLAYFMVKDWIKSSKQNELLSSVAVALEKVAVAMNMCNKNGAI